MIEGLSEGVCVLGGERVKLREVHPSKRIH